MTVRTPRLDKRLTIEAPVRAEDGAGGASLAWTPVGVRWAEIAPGAGRVFFEAKRLNPQVTHTVTLRFWQALTAAHRFRLGERVFLIDGLVDADEAHLWHVCTCEEVVAG